MAPAAAGGSDAETFKGRACSETRSDRPAVRADRQALGPARRPAPESLGRPDGNKDPGKNHPRARPAARARRQAPAETRRPAGNRRARPGIAGRPRLFSPGDRRAARRAYSRFPTHDKRRGDMSLRNILLGTALAAVAGFAAAQERPPYGPE